MAALFAAKAGPSTTSDLYSVDPVTGAMTSIGPIGFAVTGLAADPTTGILYGSTSGNSAASPHSIITIDKATGAGTLVGDLGLGVGHNAADICFDATGQLWGWDSHGNSDNTIGLISIDKATGAAVHVGSPGLITNGDAMDFDAGGVLWLFPQGAGAAYLTTYYTVNTATGAITDQFPPNHVGFGPISGDLVAGSVDETDVFYAILKGASVRLITIATATGTITNIATLQANTDALAWDKSSPPPPPSTPVLIAEPPWRFVVADVVFNGSSPPGFSTLTFLDHRAINRQIRYYLRQAATCSGRVAADDPEINILATDGEPFLAEGVRMLIGLRREGGSPPWVPRFAGPILQVPRVVENDVPWVDFTAFSVRQLLYKRPVRDGNGLLLGTSGLTFKGVQGKTILLALLDRTFVADGWHFIDTTTGTIEDTDPIDINFQQGSSVGEALDQLEQTSTMDVLLPAVYDPVGSPGILAQLNVHVLAGSVKHAAIMSWDMAGSTLAGINWLEDGQQRENNVELYTADGRPTPVVSDSTSIAKFGSYWGQQNYPVQTQLPAITVAAANRLLKNKDHPDTLQLAPIPRLAPVPLTEYGLADWLPTYASRRLGKAIDGSVRPYRVYEMGLDLPDDSGETANLLVSANLEPLS